MAPYSTRCGGSSPGGMGRAILSASSPADTGKRERLVCLFFQAEDGIRDLTVTGVQTCALPISRRLVLRGADGLVFVADSQFDRLRENVESLRDLEANLREYESTLDEIPYVLQYNKRDLPNLAPVTYLEFVLNRRATRVPFFEASAVRGKGVFDTLNTVSRMALASEFGGKRERRDEAS